MSTEVYDDMCAWPYTQPYGMVVIKKPRKPRKPRSAKDKWLKPRTKRTHRAAAIIPATPKQLGQQLEMFPELISGDIKKGETE